MLSSILYEDSQYPASPKLSAEIEYLRRRDFAELGFLNQRFRIWRELQ